jgi:PAS domain-containing protein
MVDKQQSRTPGPRRSAAPKKGAAGTGRPAKADPVKAGATEGAATNGTPGTLQQQQDKLDQLGKAVAEAGEFAQSVLDTIREPQLVLDAELTVMTANEAFLTTFEQAPDAVLGRPLREIVGGAWHKPQLVELLLKVLPKKKRLADYELDLTAEVPRPCIVTLNAIELVHTPGTRRLMLLTVTKVECPG